MRKATFSARALALALTVGACSAAAGAAAPVAGTGDVRVVDYRFVPTSESGPGPVAGSSSYVMTNVELTNDTAHDFTPQISRFFLTTPRNARYQGIEAGSSLFVGVSNSHRPLKQGEKRLYAVGFRTAEPLVTGTVSYEP